MPHEERSPLSTRRHRGAAAASLPSSAAAYEVANVSPPLVTPPSQPIADAANFATSQQSSGIFHSASFDFPSAAPMGRIDPHEASSVPQSPASDAPAAAFFRSGGGEDGDGSSGFVRESMTVTAAAGAPESSSQRTAPQPSSNPHDTSTYRGRGFVPTRTTSPPARTSPAAAANNGSGSGRGFRAARRSSPIPSIPSSGSVASSTSHSPTDSPIHSNAAPPVEGRRPGRRRQPQQPPTDGSVSGLGGTGSVGRRVRPPTLMLPQTMLIQQQQQPMHRWSTGTADGEELDSCSSGSPWMEGPAARRYRKHPVGGSSGTNQHAARRGSPSASFKVHVRSPQTSDSFEHISDEMLTEAIPQPLSPSVSVSLTRRFPCWWWLATPTLWLMLSAAVLLIAGNVLTDAALDAVQTDASTGTATIGGSLAAEVAAQGIRAYLHDTVGIAVQQLTSLSAMQLVTSRWSTSSQAVRDAAVASYAITYVEALRSLSSSTSAPHAPPTWWLLANATDQRNGSTSSVACSRLRGSDTSAGLVDISTGCGGCLRVASNFQASRVLRVDAIGVIWTVTVCANVLGTISLPSSYGSTQHTAMQVWGEPAVLLVSMKGSSSPLAAVVLPGPSNQSSVVASNTASDSSNVSSLCVTVVSRRIVGQAPFMLCRDTWVQWITNAASASTSHVWLPVQLPATYPSDTSSLTTSIDARLRVVPLAITESSATVVGYLVTFSVSDVSEWGSQSVVNQAQCGSLADEARLAYVDVMVYAVASVIGLGGVPLWLLWCRRVVFRRQRRRLRQWMLHVTVLCHDVVQQTRTAASDDVPHAETDALDDASALCRESEWYTTVLVPRMRLKFEYYRSFLPKTTVSTFRLPPLALPSAVLAAQAASLHGSGIFSMPPGSPIGVGIVGGGGGAEMAPQPLTLTADTHVSMMQRSRPSSGSFKEGQAPSGDPPHFLPIPEMVLHPASPDIGGGGGLQPSSSAPQFQGSLDEAHPAGSVVGLGPKKSSRSGTELFSFALPVRPLATELPSFIPDPLSGSSRAPSPHHQSPTRHVVPTSTLLFTPRAPAPSSLNHSTSEAPALVISAFTPRGPGTHSHSTGNVLSTGMPSQSMTPEPHSAGHTTGTAIAVGTLSPHGSFGHAPSPSSLSPMHQHHNFPPQQQQQQQQQPQPGWHTQVHGGRQHGLSLAASPVPPQLALLHSHALSLAVTATAFLEPPASSRVSKTPRQDAHRGTLTAAHGGAISRHFHSHHTPRPSAASGTGDPFTMKQATIMSCVWVNSNSHSLHAAGNGSGHMDGEVGGAGSMEFGTMSSAGSMSPRVNARHFTAEVQKFLRVALEAVEQCDGAVIELTAKSVTVSWNAVSPYPFHELRAVQCAMHLCAQMDEQCPEVSVHIGIVTGPTLVGNVGTSRTMRRCVMGVAVSFGQLLAKLAQRVRCAILLAESTYFMARSHVTCIPVEVVAYDGQMFLLFEALSARSSSGQGQGHGASTVTADQLDAINRGFAALCSGNFEQAVTYYSHVADAYRAAKEPPDAQVERLLRLCSSRSAGIDTNMATMYARSGPSWLVHEVAAEDVRLPDDVLQVLGELPPPEVPASDDDMSQSGYLGGTSPSVHSRTRRPSQLNPVFELRAELERQLIEKTVRASAQSIQMQSRDSNNITGDGDGGICASGFEDGVAFTEDACDSPLRNPVGSGSGGGGDDGLIEIVDRRGQCWRRSNKRLGKGTFGEVFVGLQSDGSLCAIKIITLPTLTTEMLLGPPRKDSPQSSSTPPALLSGTPPGDERTKTPLAAPFASFQNFVAFSRRGSGDSSAPPRRLSRDMHMLQPHALVAEDTPTPQLSQHLMHLDTSSGAPPPPTTPMEQSLSAPPLLSGAGGMGILSREVEQFLQEVATLSMVKSDHVVRYFGSAVHDGTICIIMEYVGGGSLAHLLHLFGSLPDASGRRFVMDILKGLKALHALKIMHRDICPNNVLVTIDGLCKLSDFGCSQSLHRINNRSSVAGTPQYMAPEACRGEPTTASDIWSVGILTHVLLTGRLPFCDEDLCLPQAVFVARLAQLTPTPAAHPAQLVGPSPPSGKLLRSPNGIPSSVMTATTTVTSNPTTTTTSSSSAHSQRPIVLSIDREHLSSDAVEFLQVCLLLEPSMRPTADQLTLHPFVLK